MQKYLIGSVIIAIIAVTFALQNSVTVPITLWFWKSEGSLAIIIMLSLLLGVILGIMFSWVGNRKKRKMDKDRQQDDMVME
ncbi:LapA family protein [Kiritimatiella glycovorans]|jgi:uncharacterized integral membrane protein|uniref:LapA family protein n=1 Tax=Kiritimatiella glycovorans TaxID=1307763 RepID=UPI0006993C17|nr:DUF1049 domain-containing protein [Bacteroidota bacterium]